MSTVAQRVQLGPFFDQGAICGAALLYHYAPGTSTLKDIWSANDMASNHTLLNPFTSDANGVFNFFADGYYKIIIRKADGTLLYTLDNWSFVDVDSPTLSQGDPIATASSMTLGGNTWAHWTGSVDVTELVGTALFYWAIADGNFSLIHSSSLIMPDTRNRKVLTGDALLFLNEGANTWRLASHMQKEGGWTGRQCTSVAATSTLSVPTDGDFIDISGTTDITAINTASAGYRFRARFIGAGLNIMYNASSMITQWARDYRTVPNEIIEFISLGSGNWTCFSLNGPKERVGITVEGNVTSATAGYLKEDGTAVSRTTYSGLFAEIGTQFGTGDGSTTFNLPDSQGRCVIHVDGSAGLITSASTNGANADTLGGKGGAQTHTLGLSEIPAHTHNVTVDTAGTNGSTAVLGSNNASDTTISNAALTAGGDGAHSNTQPWIAKNKWIRF